ncbi:MAG: bifunctional oligoribonuclease/PAP phosphatase NrnA [Bacteroidales bacterium]|jgi:phosphoesterase RecJ-like protein|nr:bifunctional oligoribonuclease/PAP phosphatase NrnA [Bacteroidales bacterium]MDD6357832.1 bifunctional oligoribonuclease/PAP phosphatase NrnA [Bacteroidales bacterium]
MISKIIPEEKIQQSKEWISESENIVITAHTSPDGDAVGASLALCIFLQKLGKKVSVFFPDSFPDFLRRLTCSELTMFYTEKKDIMDKAIAEADLIFALDYNELYRIDRMAESVKNSKARKIMIDHHLNPDGFCDLTISHPEIASTCEMIFRFICRMGYFTLLDKECAECIYVGMMTDTGNFSYNSNNPEIYTIISELIKKGIDKDELHDAVFCYNTETRLKMLGFIFDRNLKFYPEFGAAILVLRRDEKKLFQSRKGDTEGFVNMPLSVRGMVFSIFAHEEDGYTKVSLRSRGDFHVNEIASRYFRGGGHPNAAGGETQLSADEIIKLMEENILNEYREKLIAEKQKFTL